MKQERALNHRTPGDRKRRDQNAENEGEMGRRLKPGMLKHIYETVQSSLFSMLNICPYRANEILKNQHYIKQTWFSLGNPSLEVHLFLGHLNSERDCLNCPCSQRIGIRS